ncbi:hypothetical protein L1887_48974 [Cichorium endivia]|nr:hypothetical protein L1887_48974 [Cichorium endivia]
MAASAMQTESKALPRLPGSTSVPSGSVPVHVEVRLRPSSTASDETMRSEIEAFLTAHCTTLEAESEVASWSDSAFLSANVDRIRIAEVGARAATRSIPIPQARLEIHIYQPSSSDIVDEFSAADPGSDEGDETTAASVAELPNRSLDGVWDSLVYEDDIKAKLLNYIYTTLLFSDASVDFNLLLELANSCKGMSGRSLRRLPVLAHAHHIGMAQAPIECSVWLRAMALAVNDFDAGLDDQDGASKTCL